MPDAQSPQPQPRGPDADRGPGTGAPLADGASLLDVLDRVLGRGIVVEPSATGALPSLDLTAGEATVTVASIERVPEGSAGWEALAGVVADAGAEREAPPAEGGAEGLWRSGEHAALKRQFERLNA